MKSRRRLLGSTALVLFVAACNYTVGECYPRGEADGAADVGVGVGPSGAGGGYGDAPPGGGTGAGACNAPEKEDEPTPPAEGGDPADTWIDCKKLRLDPVECMIRCGQVGTACRPSREHPLKPDGGYGDLFSCKNGWPTSQCSYIYPNGDTCIFFAALGHPFPFCVYTGGKK